LRQYLVRTHLVTSPDPATRMQTLQMLQIVHFLWPPFLFGGLYRAGRGALRANLDTLLHNLP
jgi:hypothetical protein